MTIAGSIFRLLGFLAEHACVVITNGFQKKSQETPRSEIDLAESIRREYLSRRK